MVNCQVVLGTAIDASILIPKFNLVSPKSFGIATSKCEEIMHEASGRFHWLITSGLFQG